jgi:hypothetical protein
MDNKAISFTLQSPYQAELADIARRQKMAELMETQAAQPLQTTSYNGIQAPISPLSGLAKVLKSYMAGKEQKDLIQEQKALGERAQRESASDFATLFGHMQGQEAQPERAPITATDDQGNFEQNRPAVPARARGTVDPSILAALRDPQAKQLAMSQLLAQMKPEAPISVKPGEILVNPKTFQPVYTAPKDEEFGTTPHYELNDKGVPQSVVYSKTGVRRVIGDAVPQNTFNAMPLEGKARLYFDMYKNQTLSADQLAKLAIDNVQLGVAVQKLIDETGQGPAGGVPLPRQGQIPQALLNMVQGNPPIAGQTVMNQPPAQPTAMPMGQPSAQVRALGAQAPAMPAPVMPAVTAQTIPAKMQREILKNQMESESKKTTSMAGLGDALRQAEEILTSKKVTPTQSGMGTAYNTAAAFFGNSPAGAAQADQLKAIAANIVLKMPRMEGPQSDRDVGLYREMAGDIGNSSLPITRRLAALETVRGLNDKYIDQQPSQSQQSMRARNPKTGQEIMSTDGGKTWKPVQGGQ